MITASPLLLGLGLATPTHGATQSQALALGVSATLADPSQATLVAGLYTRTGVDHRGSVVINSAQAEGQTLDQNFFVAAEDGRWPTTAERMRAFDASAGVLALRAARLAMAEAGVSPDQITDLVTVSCTGLSSPGVDIELMTGLLLSASVRRVNIGFMGCHGAIVALRTCAALATANSTANSTTCSADEPRPPRVLAVCIELCSLHLQRTSRVDRHVSNALFADGCAAMIVGCAASPPPSRPLSPSPPQPASLSAGVADVAASAEPFAHTHMPKHDGPTHPPLLRIVDASSMLFPNSTAAMGWQIGDHGFEMTLDRTVPALLERHLSDWLWPWLRSHLGSAAGPDDVLWAIHPGGPRVLDSVANALGLNEEQTRDSRTVLRAHGNMSSPTVLFIVDRLRSRQNDARPVVTVAFGPGLTGEAALMQRVS